MRAVIAGFQGHKKVIKVMIERSFLVSMMVGLVVSCGPAPRTSIEDTRPDAEMMTPDELDPVLARVDGTLIRRSDVEREAQAQHPSSGAMTLQPGSEAFSEILEQLIDQRLLALEARRRGLNQADEARRRLALAEERILGNVLVETALADAVTDETVRRIYEEQIRLIQLGEEVRARHILVDTREEAEALAALLDAGEDFAEMAIRVSQDHATRLEGGDLGYFSREGILPSFGSVAFATDEGEISAPFQSEFGWHILIVVDRRRQPPPSLESMRPNIVRYYTFDQLESLVGGLREEADITRYSLPSPEMGDEDTDITLDPAMADEGHN